MKIIISPAKKMNNECAFIKDVTIPVFMNKTKQLHLYLKDVSYDDLKKLLVLITII